MLGERPEQDDGNEQRLELCEERCRVNEASLQQQQQQQTQSEVREQSSAGMYDVARANSCRSIEGDLLELEDVNLEENGRAKSPCDKHDLENQPHQPEQHDHNEDANAVESKANVSEVPAHQRNVYVLLMEFVLFGGFAIAEIIFALAGNSLSLLGDACCMLVDTLTYGMNIIAERMKGKGVSRKTRLQLEFFIPVVSVLGLLATSTYILVEAIKVVQDGDVVEDDTNDVTMLIFACVNMLIDFVSVFIFVRIKGFLGFETVEKETEDNEITDANTNMCSAYTHVLADTLRSIAVIVTASVSMSIESVNGTISDAWAAIGVSIIIFFSIIPLCRGLKQKFFQLRAL